MPKDTRVIALGEGSYRYIEFWLHLIANYAYWGMGIK